MKREMDVIEDIVKVYDKLRKREANRGKENMETGVSPSERTQKLESTIQLKSKQIESQQALLNDLQSQLSSKEKEVRDLNSRLTTSVNQATQLRSQLEATHKLMQEKEMEVIRLRNEIRAIENADKIELVETLNRSAPMVVNESQTDRVPKKIQVTRKLTTNTASSPACIATSRGSQIVAVGTNKLHCFNAMTGGIICEAEMSSSSSILSACVSPDSDAVLIGTSESQLSLVNLNGRILKDLKGHGGKVKGVGFLGSKYKAFSVATDRTIKLWDLTRASPIRSVPVTSQLIGGAATSDGTMMVTCHLNGRITVWSMNDKICELEGHTDTCLGVSISPDGRFITSVGKDDTVTVTDIHMAQSGPIHTLKGFKPVPVDTSPACSLDSKIVSVSATDGIHHWDLVLGQHLGVSSCDPLGVVWTAPPSLEPNQSTLVSIHANGTVKWWSP
jgi:predicted  nucleic acid-binding Zn-ribbon protein